MKDRREVDRRSPPKVAEPLERRGERREMERRDSPRKPTRLLVADGRGGYLEVDGDLGLYGASWLTSAPPRGDELDLCYAAEGDTSVLTRARVVGREARGGRTCVRVAFSDQPLQAELALARWLDQG